MTSQTISQSVLVLGILLTALGTGGSYYFGKIEERENQRKSANVQNELNSQITKLQSTFDAKTDLIFKALKVKQDVWTSVETDMVPPGMAEFLFLIFKADKGRISGKVRIKGSEETAYFSTSANDTTPVAVPNLWVPSERQYKVPTVIEFTVTEKSVPDFTLSIFTQGFIDSMGKAPY